LKIQNAKGKIEEVIRHLVLYVFSQRRTIANPPPRLLVEDKSGGGLRLATRYDRQDGCGSLKTGPA
jgi:hypothetical protein